MKKVILTSVLIAILILGQAINIEKSSVSSPNITAKFSQVALAEGDEESGCPAKAKSGFKTTGTSIDDFCEAIAIKYNGDGGYYDQFFYDSESAQEYATQNNIINYSIVLCYTQAVSCYGQSQDECWVCNQFVLFEIA